MTFNQKPRNLALTSALAVSLLLAAGADAKGPRGAIVSYGITRNLSAPVDRPDPSVPGGATAFVQNMEIAKETDRIEARLGTAFGISFIIGGLEPGKAYTFRKVVKHPPMKMPDGTVSTGYTRNLPAVSAGPKGVATNLQGYSFDEPYELVPGTWSIEIWWGEKRMVGKDFSVVSGG